MACNSSHEPLFDRFRDDGVPSTELNQLQRAARSRVLSSIGDGEYPVEDVEECVCGGRGLTRICMKDRAGLPLGVVLCGQCGLLLTSPRLKHEGLPCFYQRDYHALVFGLDSPDQYDALVSADQGTAVFGCLKRHLPSGGSLDVAEIGCGPGQVLAQFADSARQSGYCVSCVGAEYSEQLVAVARRRGVSAFGGDTTVLLEQGLEADVVILSHVLEHMTDLPGELDRVKRLLRPAGLLYVEVPGVFGLDDPTSHWAYYKGDLLRYFTCAHMYHFCLESLTFVLGRVGWELLWGDEYVRSVFRRTDARHSALPQNLPQRTRSFLVDLEKRRKRLFRRRISAKSLLISILRPLHLLGLAVAAKRLLRRAVGCPRPPC